jgi:CRISPR-associated protein Csm2
MLVNEQNYVDEAERVIKALIVQEERNARNMPLVTTSKLRNLLAMSADIYNEVINQKEDKLSEDICARIEYLRVRFLYESGRENSVKNLVVESKLMDVLKEINGSRKKYILFSRYMEALVAFRKFYGKKDD